MKPSEEFAILGEIGWRLFLLSCGVSFGLLIYLLLTRG